MLQNTLSAVNKCAEMDYCICLNKSTWRDNYTLLEKIGGVINYILLFLC